MPEQPPQRPFPAANLISLDEAHWRQLVDAHTAEEFAAAWLALQAGTIGDVVGGVVELDRPDTGGRSQVAVWPAGFRTVGLSTVIRVVEREQKGNVKRAADDPAGGLHVAYPIWVAGAVVGVVAFQIGARPKPELERAMRRLQWGTAWIQNWYLRHQSTQRSPASDQAATALELVGLVLEEPRFTTAATAAATELAARLDCDRVSIGFVVRDQVKVRALSHSAQFGKQMNLIRAIAAAMGESVDQQALLVYPQPERAEPRLLHAHEQLSRSHASATICTVPFVDRDGKAFGALTFERSVAQPFDQKTIELCDGVASLLGPVLDEKRKNDRLLPVKAGDSFMTQFRRLFGPRYALRKVLSVLAVAVVLFFAFASGQYRVTSKATLEGEVRMAVAAPFRGFVVDAPVRGGDIVKKGQLMCQLDVRDLRLEYSRWSGEREQYVLEHRRAMAAGDRAAMNVLNNKMTQAEAQIELLDQQIARGSIHAPLDGLVVSGDLSQALGAPVDAGNVLFEVAPLDSYRVMIQVDEKDIAQIQQGQRGALVLTAMPAEELEFTVSRITPVSAFEEGRNFFTVEATLDQGSTRLRPGMEGFGKIEIERRKLIWIWTHDMGDWIRLKAWTWLP